VRSKLKRFQCCSRVSLAVATLLYLVYIYQYVVIPMAFKFQQDSLWRILTVCAEVLHKCEVVYTLDQGTLLGLYRDHDLILGDTDIDLLLLGWEQRTKLLECPEADEIFQAHGLVFDRERNANGGLAVRDQYNFYADVDTTVLVQGDSGPLLRDKTLPHCQPGIIEQASHRVACERPVDMCLPAQILVLGKAMAQPTAQLVTEIKAAEETLTLAAKETAVATKKLKEAENLRQTHHDVQKQQSFLVPHDAAGFLELKYPGWQTPKRYDKGTDTTAWDTFKSNNLWFTDFLFVTSMGVRIAIYSRQLSLYLPFVGLMICLVGVADRSGWQNIPDVTQPRKRRLSI